MAYGSGRRRNSLDRTYVNQKPTPLVKTISEDPTNPDPTPDKKRGYMSSIPLHTAKELYVNLMIQDPTTDELSAREARALKSPIEGRTDPTDTSNPPATQPTANIQLRGETRRLQPFCKRTLAEFCFSAMGDSQSVLHGLLQLRHGNIPPKALSKVIT